jgi:hypothetical protein
MVRLAEAAGSNGIAPGLWASGDFEGMVLWRGAEGRSRSCPVPSGESLSLAPPPAVKLPSRTGVTHGLMSVMEGNGMATRPCDGNDTAGSSTNGVSPRDKGRVRVRQPSSSPADRAAQASCSQRTCSTACWPKWARVLVSLGLAFHIAAMLAGAWGVPPSSALQRAFADLFMPYFDLVDFGYSYRFYTEPPPTPVVTATIHFGPSRADEVVRLPARDLAGPRLRHQRQLALANALFRDVLETRERAGRGAISPLATAYARHICRTRPGCQHVAIHLQQHLIPEMDVAARSWDAEGAPAFDLFDESLFSTPEWIGDFPCDAL